MVEQWRNLRATLVWWSLVAGMAAALKGYFSAAAASELEWILRPVSWLLRLVAGWNFEQNELGEWYSLDAGIILVKACAGINFMILSFAAWCWIARPLERSSWRQVAFEWPVLLGSSLVFAWGTALAVNTIRVLAIVHWQPALEQWLPADEAHRLLGLTLYITALNLQLLLFDRRRWQRTVLITCGLYAVLMLVVPLLTGNAAANPALYFRHLLTSMAVLLPLSVLALARWRGHASGHPS